MIPAWILSVGIIVAVLGSAYGIRNGMSNYVPTNGILTEQKPTIWWIVDDSQVNARQWLDWGNRSTREPNEPYLKICMAQALNRWTPHFTVEPVIGRLAALQKLEAAGVKVPEGADRAPPALWMPYCRSAFLSTFGGLWLDGSVIPLGAGSELRSRLLGKPVLMFGADPDEHLASAAAEDEKGPAAGRTSGWAATPGHPMWSGLARDVGALIAAGDQSWSAPEARRSQRFMWDKHCSGVTAVDRDAEVSRDRYGRRLELDVLLGQTEWVDGSTKGGLWVPLPEGRDGLERASPWLWFTRMSVEQIKESDFVWSKWATKV